MKERSLRFWGIPFMENGMEKEMSNRTIKHEIKLQKSVIIILGVLAVGVFANAFAPALTIKEALAQTLGGSISISHSGYITN